MLDHVGFVVLVCLIVMAWVWDVRMWTRYDQVLFWGIFRISMDIHVESNGVETPRSSPDSQFSMSPGWWRSSG